MAPSRGELLAALDVFGPWLDEEMQRANQTVGEGFNAKTATLPEVAELVGLARGLGAAEGFLRAKLDTISED